MTEISLIIDFIQKAQGLDLKMAENYLEIVQITDGKSLLISPSQIDQVIERQDNRMAPFIQVNFISEKKIILTESLIGFKPLAKKTLGRLNLPEVVTTSDLVNVIEAIQDALVSHRGHPDDLELFRNVYQAILLGGEAIGFDLRHERTWLNRLTLGQAGTA